MIRIARVAAGAQKELDIAKTEMVKIAKVATAAQRELDIARRETRLLNKVINGLQQRLDELEGRGSVAAISVMSTLLTSGVYVRASAPLPVQAQASCSSDASTNEASAMGIESGRSSPARTARDFKAKQHCA